jgi:isopentenyldiphosphate isomerase
MADNPDELFDVVDTDDRVIGVARRAQVHARGLRHRAVHILVLNREDKVFLQKRSKAKDSHPGKWDSSASGHLDSGEAYAAAAIRELHEELGIGPVRVEEIGRLPAGEITGRPTQGPFVSIRRRSRPGNGSAWRNSRLG